MSFVRLTKQWNKGPSCQGSKLLLRHYSIHFINPKQWMHMDQASTPLVTLCHILEFMLMSKSFFIFVAPHAGRVWIKLWQAASWLSSDPSPR